LGQWCDVEMSAYTLQASTQYAIVLKAPNGDASNTVTWRGNNSNPYSGGTFWYSQDSGVLWTGVNQDMGFEVWGH